jgi:(p)ppGpp synthase/HD superfamily hydrolase
VVEDTHSTLTEIKELRQRGRDRGDGVTNSPNPFSTWEEAQAENIRKMILAMSKDIG